MSASDDELVIAPQPGPQTQLLESDCDITFFGGQGGGGKTWVAILALARWYWVALYTGILFRRQAVDLEGAESAWEQSKRICGVMGANGRQSPVHSWRWPESGATIEMRHLQHEGDELDHAGKAYACIVFEELTQFSARQFWFLISRLRSTCGVRPHVIATLNPDPEHWVYELVSWFIDPESGLPIASRSGVKRYLVRRGDDSFDFDESKELLEARNPGRAAMSFTFIESKLSDNPALTEKDPDYAKRLDAIATVDRDRLKFGRWTRASKSGGYFKEDFFPLIAMAPARPTRTIRFWDLAATERSTDSPDPDFTRGLKGCSYVPGPQFLAPGQVAPSKAYALLDLKGGQLSVAAVDDLVVKTAIEDGKSCEVGIWQDPGQAGKAQAYAFRKKLADMGFMVTTIPASQDKLSYAKVWSPLARDGHISVIDAPWARPFLQRLEAFPNGRYKDDVDAGSGLFQMFTRSVEVKPYYIRGL